MNVLSLCSGIGGLDLGLEQAGMTTVGQVEIDSFCRRVLAKHWPEVPRHDDVRTAIEWWFSQDRPDVELIAAGFPCQPVSNAGARLGEDDERWLWPAVAHVIASLEPEWVLFENVPGLRTKGLESVVTDLADLGYRVTVGRISACSVGAPHTRERLFGVAHAPGFRRQWEWRPESPAPQELEHEGRRPEPRWSWPAQSRPHGVAYGVPSRVDRLRAIGNAVVPAVGDYIGRLIMLEARGRAAA